MKTYGDDWLTDGERAELAALRSKPRLSMYDQDDVDTFKQLAGIRSATEKLRKKAAAEGLTLEAWFAEERKQREAAVANDN